MPTSRSYGDACTIARALDVVGERWALLVVRELLLGPQRFSDVRRALPGASSNLVTDRLRELTGHGVVTRRKLPPPAASTVYELTEWGRELEPVVLALGAWGSRLSLPPSAHLGTTSTLLFLRGFARPRSAACFHVELDSRVWTVRAEPGRLTVEPGEPAAPDATIRTDPPTLNALLEVPSDLDAAIADGRMRIEGDRKAVRRLLRETLSA
ncbi:winged helix-turn-helix transcriptional regulator [Amycolatopsis australiensis]|uniref:DNA-binding transcriptional regulator, HxlR family n=1 Tax=Amycolatopsis australiensis TaxID=546364 RepID=A0A1K1T5L2_9PSEU|nr:winged helix-turn-helix transcriptional regulator [Amycolatopsis australiensis]SFW91820.1 DNA-binding transcriptional regulator, HxlR family [Amycolatopsis australiensis]